MRMPSTRAGALRYSLAVILSAFAVELGAGLYSGSLGLVADSAHALLDAVVTAVLLIAVRMAAKPPDADHTYGHGKIESLAGMLAGIAILMVAAFFVYEAASRLAAPAPAHLPGLFAAAAGIYVMGADVFRIVLLRRSVRALGGPALRADLYHAAMDLCSTGVAVAGIVLVSYGIHHGDFAAALVLGGLLAVLSVRLVYSAAQELTDVISPETVARVRQAARQTEGVTDVGAVLVRRSGDRMFADVTLYVSGDASFDVAHRISDEAEEAIRSEVGQPISATVHCEPSWDRVPLSSRISEIASSVPGVRDVHNASSYTFAGRLYVSLHVMVDGSADLREAHRISDLVEAAIRSQAPEVGHATVHLEPHVAVSGELASAGSEVAREARRIIAGHPKARGTGRIATFGVKDAVKVDADCLFDPGLSIEEVHAIVSEIEQEIHGRFKNIIVTIHPEPYEP